MISAKLVSLLASFSQEEIKDFVKFSASPFFNNEKPVQTLVTFLAQTYPDLSEKKLKKEKVFSKIYPGKEFNDGILRTLTSKVLKLAERYLAIKQFEDSPGKVLISKMRILGDKNQNFLFNKEVEFGNKLFEDYPYKESTYFYTRMMFEDEIRRFAMRSDSKVFLPDDNYQNVVDNCIKFFTVELLRCYAVMINANKHLMENDFDFRFFDTLMKFFEDNQDFFKDVYYAQLYYNSIKLFITEEEQYYDRVHEIANKHYDQLHEIDQKNCYVVLGNYCAEMMNKGKINYLRKRFELNKEILSKGAHYEGLPFISHVFFNRVAYYAINLGELEWAKSFLDENKIELPENHRENTYNLSMAEYYLKLKEFDKALESLSHVQRIDRFYKQQVYAISLKIFYAADMTESFYSELASFRSFLRTSNVISDRHRKLDSNFLKLLLSLQKIKEKRKLDKQAKIIELREEIIKDQYTSEKYWLLQKLEELERVESERNYNSSLFL